MKLPPSRVDAFLRRPDPEVRAVLLYGPDAGLVRERADNLARTIVPDWHDPFRVAELPATVVASDPARLADEAAQLALMGGRRVVRVRDAGDAVAAACAGFLAGAHGDALVVVEAGDLPGRSALRQAFDDSPRAAAIGCYPDSSRDLAAVIRESLGAHRLAASRDAIEFLVQNLGGDRMLTRSELEKLSLYAAGSSRIELDDARAAIADTAALALDDAVLAAADGNAAALDRALGRVFQEGESAVAAIRALLRHFQRLHNLAARVAAGASPEEAIRSARPPIFFKQHDHFQRQLGRWSEVELRRCLGALVEAEVLMKTTGMPAETICRAAMLSLAAP